MKTREELRAEGFILVDDDTNQWVKKLSDSHFIVYEQEVECDIDLNDYTEEQLDDYVAAYYPSLPEMRELYGNDANQIIAECIAETDIFEV